MCRFIKAMDKYLRVILSFIVNNTITKLDSWEIALRLKLALKIMLSYRSSPVKLLVVIGVALKEV